MTRTQSGANPTGRFAATIRCSRPAGGLRYGYVVGPIVIVVFRDGMTNRK